VGAFGTLTDEAGVRVRSARANGFELAELQFPPDYVQAPFEPERPYLAIVIEGGLAKSFATRTMRLAHGTALSMPVGARHGARFGHDGARVVVVKPSNGSQPARGCLDRLAELHGRGFAWLAWRLAAELRASDRAAPLAAEAFALELLAAASRAGDGERAHGRPPAWLEPAAELLRSRERIGLGAVADAVGVHPAHLARVFRAHHGMSVGEFARRTHVEWAATQLARTDSPLAVVAAEAGFADQSHFTRLFKKHVGITPARYRAETRRADE
jgi:AraC family transcriptional regulator